MGKASKWFRGLLGLKKSDSASSSLARGTETARSSSKPPKKKWSFVKSYRETTEHDGVEPRERAPNGPVAAPAQISGHEYTEDPEKHAIAVAAATAAVAEAAVAAAQAAAAVVRLTSSGRSNAASTSGALNTVAYVCSGSFVIREEWAAVKIQSHFRAYLARRAFRALKALVKLQALVRGNIVRKQTADMLRRMQALLRAQVRARAGRVHISESPYSSSKSSKLYQGPATPEKFEHVIRARTKKQDPSMLKRNCSKSNGSRVITDLDKSCVSQNRLDIRVNEGGYCERGSFVRTGTTDDEKSDKILEVDTGKPQFTHKCRSLFQSSHLSLCSDQNSHTFTTSKDSAHHTAPSPSCGEVQSFSPFKCTQDVEVSSFCTVDNSPQYYSASSKGGSSRRGPFTPTKTNGSRSCLSGYSDHPNYMAYTESSKAKVRSLSAPKQRPHQFERSFSTKRYSVHGFGDSRSGTQQFSALLSTFTSRAYPGSGRLDRLGMPMPGNAAGFSGGHWNRC